MSSSRLVRDTGNGCLFRMAENLTDAEGPGDFLEERSWIAGTPMGLDMLTMDQALESVQVGSSEGRPADRVRPTRSRGYGPEQLVSKGIAHNSGSRLIHVEVASYSVIISFIAGLIIAPLLIKRTFLKLHRRR